MCFPQLIKKSETCMFYVCNLYFLISVSPSVQKRHQDFAKNSKNLIFYKISQNSLIWWETFTQGKNLKKKYKFCMTWSNGEENVRL